MNKAVKQRNLPFPKNLAKSLSHFLSLFSMAFILFALLLLIFGKNPFRAYMDIFLNTLGSAYGISETLVKMTPLILTALATAIPSRIWLINVGGEGQFHMGAILATWAALNLGFLPAWVLLPMMIIAGFLGGGLWSMLSGFLRAKGWISETISTLLLNYVAILLVSFLVFGPWKDPESANYPQTAEFGEAAILFTFGQSRVHLGIFFAVAGLLGFHFIMGRTKWGLEMRAMATNMEAARRNGINIEKYYLILMLIGGGLAGLAGMCEVSAIQGRLRPNISPGYGYMGFLISWMAMGNPWGIATAAFLLAVVTAGGDILQMTQGVTGSVVNILLALILFVVLAKQMNVKGQK